MLKRKVLGTKFYWCSDRDSWLERVVVAHREAFSNSSLTPLTPVPKAKLVDALVWRFKVTGERDMSVGGMIMSPKAYVRCGCSHYSGKAVRMNCMCMWCHKYTACVYAHELDMKYDPKFAKDVKLPKDQKELGYSINWTVKGVWQRASEKYVKHLGELSKLEAKEIPQKKTPREEVDKNPPPSDTPIGQWLAQYPSYWTWTTATTVPATLTTAPINAILDYGKAVKLDWTPDTKIIKPK